MRTVTFILFWTLTLSVSAQNNWVKPNAKWYFSIWGGHPGGYQKVEHIGDTLIEGIQCMTFQETEYISYPQPNSEPILIGPTIKGKQFLHYRNDTVFYRVDNRFEILFDFNANTGDSWILNSDVEADAMLECDTVSTQFVTATENFETNGNTYKVLQLETDSVSPLDCMENITVDLDHSVKDTCFQHLKIVQKI